MKHEIPLPTDENPPYQEDALAQETVAQNTRIYRRVVSLLVFLSTLLCLACYAIPVVLILPVYRDLLDEISLSGSDAPSPYYDAENPTAGAQYRPENPPARNAPYRESDPRMTGATGRPQIIIFYNDEEFCPDCAVMRPRLHQLENEFWGEVDFVYLQRNEIGNNEIRDHYLGVLNLGFDLTYVLVDVQGRRVREPISGGRTEGYMRSLIENELLGEASAE